MKGKEAEAERLRRGARRREIRRENEDLRFAARSRRLARHLETAYPYLGRRGARMIVCVIDRVWRKMSYRKYRSHLKSDAAAREWFGFRKAPSVSTLQSRTEKLACMAGVLQEILLWQAGRRAYGTLVGDSSGFSICKKKDWRHAKYGKLRVKDFAKLSVLVCLDGTIVAFDVTTGNGGDAPAMRRILKVIPDGSGHIILDRAYGSSAIHERAEETGRTAVVPSKISDVARGYGPRARMIRLYRERRERFDRVYNRRARVESLFASMKARLGGDVAARSLPLQRVLLACKCICHNMAL